MENANKTVSVDLQSFDTHALQARIGELRRYL